MFDWARKALNNTVISIEKDLNKEIQTEKNKVDPHPHSVEIKNNCGCIHEHLLSDANAQSEFFDNKIFTKIYNMPQYDRYGNEEMRVVECNECKKILKITVHYSRYTSDHNGIFHYDYSVLDNSSDKRVLSTIPLTEENATVIARILGTITPDYFLTRYSIDNDNEYAIEFKNKEGDRKGLCVVKNVIVPDRWIFEKDSLTIEDFVNAENTETRMRFMSLIGDERIKKILGDAAKTKDSFYTSSSKIELMEIFVRNTRIKIIKAKNNWDDNPYYLFVPPWIKTAREGVAWSYYQDPTEYNPVVEA